MAGKHVLVTAAGRGIGRACAEAFRDAGATVCATDLDPASLKGLDGARTSVLDGSDAPAVRAFVQACDPFDAVVHCVGLVASGTVLDCPPEEWARLFAVNVDSFYHLLRAVLPAMVAGPGGSITCIASVVSSLKGVPDRAAYGATKAALIGLVKSVAADFAGAGVRCNAVCPGTVLSPSLEARIDALGATMGGRGEAMAQFVSRQPLGRLGTPEEVAGLCLYLAGDLGRFVTGQAIAVDGGMTI